MNTRPVALHEPPQTRQEEDQAMETEESMATLQDTKRNEASIVQIARARKLLETTAWSDTHAAAKAVAEGLRYARELTQDDVIAGETELDGNRIDECAVHPQEARAMPTEWRLAHLARLIRSIAINYGLDPDERTAQPTDRLNSNSPAAVLAELDEIVHLPPPTWEEELNEWERVQAELARGVDPRTAGAHVMTGYVGGYCYGRVPHWHDLDTGVTVSDWVMRSVWPDLAPQWDELLAAAGLPKSSGRRETSMVFTEEELDALPF
jgi:hypothetical protein